MGFEAILILWLIGLGLLLAELFVGGGIAGGIGALAMLGAVLAAVFTLGPGWGAGLTVASLAAGGAVVALAIRQLSHTHVMSHDGGFVGTDDRSDLVGQRGEAATVLRPAGLALIAGQRVDVVSGGERLERGTPIEVVAVEGNRVEVRSLAP